MLVPEGKPELSFIRISGLEMRPLPLAVHVAFRKVLYFGPMQEEAMTLTLTENAASKIHSLLAAENNEALHLRVFVSGGGCSGFQYGFSFDEQVNDNDTVVESRQVKMLVDPMSLELLNGAEIDYQESLQGASFVIRNPNAAATCGCGKSFTPSESGGCVNAGY